MAVNQALIEKSRWSMGDDVIMNEPTLCFVKGNWAYFKTDSDEKPSNWDLVPYTCVDPPQGYIKLQFCVEMERPDGPYPEYCCPYSVDQINAGEVPWLKLGNDVGIMGGCPITEFVQQVIMWAGAVALPFIADYKGAKERRDIAIYVGAEISRRVEILIGHSKDFFGELEMLQSGARPGSMREELR